MIGRASAVARVLVACQEENVRCAVRCGPLERLTGMIGWVGIAAASEVTLEGATWMALQAPDPARIAAPPPIWARRDVTLVSLPEALRVEATWTVIVAEAGWVSLPLADAAMRVRAVSLDGDVAGVTPIGDALVWTGQLSQGVHRLVLAGTLDGSPEARPMVVRLAPGAAGEARWGAPGGRVDAQADGVLRLALAPAVATSDAGPSARADVGLGVVVGEGSAAFAARLSWTVERGTLDSVAFDAPGAGADLQVTGAEVTGWSRTGDRITVTLGRPATRSVRVEARWTSPIGEVVAVPTVAPVGVRRVRAALQVARDGALEPVPELNGWTAVASRDLPEWAAGLAPGAPVGSWTSPAPAGGRIALLAFEPTAGPPAIVDVAEWTAATTDSGRLLLSGRLEVRNDRAAWLRVAPPPGSRILSARVDGKTAVVGGGGGGGAGGPGGGGVDGLLSFPVELVVLGEGEDWERGANRVLLPTVDAPVAVTRATVYLPPGWRDRSRVGEGNVVPAFSEGEGITYGLATGAEAAVADALFQSAVNAWKDNDFDAAQQALDDVRGLGGDNENVRRLQGNVDLINSDEEDGEVTVVERRVLEQAKARSYDDAIAQEEKLAEAEEAELKGEYDKAEKAYGEARALGEDLQRLDSAKADRAGQLEALDQKVVALGKKKSSPSAAVSSTVVSEPEAASAPKELRDEASPLVQVIANQILILPPQPVVAAVNRPDVAATTTGVVVPALGSAVRFQQILLPAGAPPRFEVDARLPRSRR